MKTNTLEILYGVENVKGRFLYQVAPVHEISHPYRVCEKALFLHLWPKKAVVFGLWKSSDNFDAHMLSALGGKVIDWAKDKARYIPVGSETVRQSQEESG